LFIEESLEAKTGSLWTSAYLDLDCWKPAYLIIESLALLD